MPLSHLWYVRRGDQRRGPYPIALIERNIGLGRIVASDWLSHDGVDWLAASDFPDFELHRDVRDPAAVRRLEERQRERRRKDAAPPDIVEMRTNDDRRQPEDPSALLRREKSSRIWRGFLPTRRNPARLFLLLAGVTLGVGVLGWWAQRSEVAREVQCDAPPAAGVIWDFCDKQGIQLNGADLRGASLKSANLMGTSLEAVNFAGAALAYANLSTVSLARANLVRANLTGAALRGANLAGADLTGANLSFADLTDAKLAATSLANADLSNAIWSDGALCVAPSIGVCVTSNRAE